MDADDSSLQALERPGSGGIHQWVYQSLRRSILCGGFPPGERLTIRGLAEKLGVSPMPVREALHRLTCEGAVAVRGNRRVMIPEMTPSRLKALYDLRIVLESHAALKAMPYVHEAELLKLEQLDRAVDASLKQPDDVQSWTLANQAFHRYLYQQNPVPAAVPLIESVWLQLGPFLHLVLSGLSENYRIDRHQEALEALRQHNGFALQRAIEADIRDGMASLESVQGLESFFGC
ncbi:MAG: GntR family transcriptional regulator [Thiothrix sp.]|nr:GntR family transcriptional regulator [Thiothrix sp.]HPQ94135.1 GntR family transcriptional regulator [Thiolinea sp.]